MHGLVLQSQHPQLDLLGAQREDAYGLGGVVVQMSITNVSVGFQGTWTTNDAAPASFTLNGAVCR